MNKDTTALLVMDMQVSIVGMMPNGADAIISKVAKAIATARNKGIPVIYVVVGFRQGLPEVSTSNRGFSAFKERLATVNMDDFMKIHPAVAPIGGEITVDGFS